MNISTGGPHILFFERDQQLAMLLTSEFQLAGYECHTARTAVEVFDAIARYPVRLVLVNLAQAAASRREFWVALDTQRRGRGVQVFTFHCFNIAGYGPRDPDESSQTMLADMEIDGMLGIMNLVDAVRARVPSMSSSNTGTLPRLPRPQPTSTNAPQPPMQQSQPSLPPTNQSTPNGLRPPFVPQAQDAPPPPTRTNQNISIQIPPNPLPGSEPQTPPFTRTPPSPLQASPALNTQTYSDKIRAVLYPAQRPWNAQNGTTQPTAPDSGRNTGEMQPVQPGQNAAYYPTQPLAQPAQSPAQNDITVLQRLANGTAGESGLAQLSRMVQERYVSRREPAENQPQQQVQPMQQMREPAPQTLPPPQTVAPQTQQMREPAPQAIQPAPQTQQMREPAPAPAPQTQQVREPAPQAAAHQQESQPTATTLTFQMPSAPQQQAPRPAPAQEITITAMPPLRASPMQEAPAERAVGGQTTTDSARRAEAAARLQATLPMPLASITMPVTSAPPSPSAQPAAVSKPAPETTVEEDTNPDPSTPPTLLSFEEKELALLLEQRRVFQQGIRPELDEPVSPSNAMLLDIVQSLPPMPPPGQPLQAQALSGRATRSLGSVLLEGHLVPENRLEVAQNIQRMLRGVDLNYQLGEILLMFKLLTPDQLLAASLVSYGMITTTQISSLGRIRQELHSIGLEYDLENLLILFRILTPDQLREVRSSWQG